MHPVHSTQPLNCPIRLSVLCTPTSRSWKVPPASYCYLSSRLRGQLWVELQSGYTGNIANGPVEERVDGAGSGWLGTTHELHNSRPFFLDPKRHALRKSNSAVLLACTVNALGQVPEPELQVLEALGFQLLASARLPRVLSYYVPRGVGV